HHRECDGHGAPCLPQCEAMALGRDGDALDGSGLAGSRKRIPTAEGVQTTASATCRSGSKSNESFNQQRPCSPNQSRITSTMATTASQILRQIIRKACF